MWNIFFWWLLLESQRKRTSELSVNIMRATDFNSKGLNKHKVDIHRLFNKLHGFRDSVLMRQIFKQILFSSLVRSLCWIPIIFCLYHCKDPWIMTITLTSKNSKEAEHDRIEKAKAHGQGVLVDDSRDDEHGEHGSCSEFPFWQLWGSGKETRGFGSKCRGQAGSVGNLCHWNYRKSVKLLSTLHHVTCCCGNTGKPKCCCLILFFFYLPYLLTQRKSLYP